MFFKYKIKSKYILSFFLFCFVFSIFAFSINNNWFYIDDLGVILNGLIKNLDDFFKIFSEDIRNYASTYNYNFPKSNVLSALFRPLQNVFFSIIYFLFGLNPYAFYVLHVFFHALNSALIFLIFTNWLSIPLSLTGAIFSAFYPNLTWMVWLCTLQNTLALSFLLLSILTYLPLLKNNSITKHKNILIIAAGATFLLSLLSRENHVFLPFWLFGGLFLFYHLPNSSIWQKIKYAFHKTFIFFLSLGIYFFIRLHAFGYESLARTANNIVIKFPILNKLITLKDTPSTTAIVNQITNSKVTNIATSSLEITNKHQSTSLLTFISIKLNQLIDSFTTSFFEWGERIFNTQNHIFITFVSIFFITFLYFSYKKQKKIAFFLLSGILFFIWPSILVYPHHRYINSAYPLFIFIILFGITFLIKRKISPLLKQIIIMTTFAIIGTSLINSFYQNIETLYYLDHSSYKNNYVTFFKENKLKKDTNFIFLSTPEEADLEQVLQTVSNNFNLIAAHVTISKFSDNCKTKNSKSTIKPIQNGFRLISLDKKNCSWSFHNYQPVRWSHEEHAYIRHPEPYKANTWYDFSMGKFIIHEIVDSIYVTDVSMVFDTKWINKNTLFVHWDTIDGKYKVLDSKHLIN